MIGRKEALGVAGDGTERKQALLYLSPVLPAERGNGLAMRAGMVLQLLARRYRVYLLVRPLYPSPEDTLTSALYEVCEEVAILPPAHSAPPSRLRGALARLAGRSPQPAFGDIRFAVVHVFRLAMLPDARPYTEGRHPPRRQLDLDDVESRTQRRIAALHRGNGDEAGAVITEALAKRTEAMEKLVLQSWDRVFVCSDLDRQALLERDGRQVCVLPNAVRLPPSLHPRRGRRPFTFLFIGTLGYYPNEDGVRFFCDAVLPTIRRRAGEPFRVVIAGFGTNPSLAALAGIPEVELVGAVPDVAPWYRDADAVVVPLRAGGGTRIKVLEAFAYERPVVSTVQGCEGIAVRDGEHLLVADTAGGMAEKCLQLMGDAGMRQRLVLCAAAFVRDRYTLDALSASDAADTLWGEALCANEPLTTRVRG